MTASSPRPAATDTTGGELRDDDWWTRLFLASSEAIDSVPYAAGREYPVPHAAAFRSAVEPALRALLAERDTLAAQVQAGLSLADGYAVMGRVLHDVSHAEIFGAVAAELRRALGTPTTEAGQ